MNDIKTSAACLKPAHPQPAAWHAAPAFKPAFKDEATRAVSDTGRIRIGAAFRLVTQR